MSRSAKLEHGAGKGVLVAILVVSTIGFGTVPLFVRLLAESGLAPAAIAFSRFLLTTLATLPFLALGPGQCLPSLMGMIAGAAMGLGWIGYVEAVEATSVAAAGVLYMTYPLFTLIFAWLLLAQRPGPGGLAAAGLVMLAAWVSVSGDVLGELSWRGLVFALAAPISFGFAITVLTGWLGRLSPMARVAPVSLGSSLGLLPVVLLLPAEQVIPQAATVPLLLATSLFTSFLPAVLYVIAAPRLGTAITAIGGSMELPVMIAIGVLAFGEALAGRQVVACMLVVAALLLMSISRLPRRRPPR